MLMYIFRNLLNELQKRDKMRGLPSILSLFYNGDKITRIQEYECKILFVLWHLNDFEI